jgi:hypothetical protein
MHFYSGPPMQFVSGVDTRRLTNHNLFVGLRPEAPKRAFSGWRWRVRLL